MLFGVVRRLGGFGGCGGLFLMVVSGVVRIDMYLQRQYHDIPVAWGKYIFVISNGTYRQAMYQLMCIKITSNILLYASLLRMN